MFVNHLNYTIMFRITKWHINPVNLLCLIMLSIILIVTTSGMNRNQDVDPNAPEVGRQDDEYYGTHPLTFRDMKEYQLEVVNDHVILYDYDRVVAVINLDKNCNLTKAIDDDNR